MAAKGILAEIPAAGSGFFNLRGSFKILAGLVEIGTHMSLLRLSSGRFLLIDTIVPTEEVQAHINRITDNGKLIEAVVATHPFHTISFRAFHQCYPNARYYGTPRHLRIIPDIPWAGDVATEAVQKMWEPEVEMRIPAGAEFIAPLPERSNHFSNVFVFHKASRTIHNDDNIMVMQNMPFAMKLVGMKEGGMYFHTSLKGPGLLPTPEAPMQYRCWVSMLIEDWDFDNLCSAHTGNKVGGAKEGLAACLAKAEPDLQKIAKRNASKPGQVKAEKGAWSTDAKDGCECG